MTPTPRVRSEMFFRRHMAKIGLAKEVKARIIEALAEEFKEMDESSEYWRKQYAQLNGEAHL